MVGQSSIPPPPFALPSLGMLSRHLSWFLHGGGGGGGSPIVEKMARGPVLKNMYRPGHGDAVGTNPPPPPGVGCVRSFLFALLLAVRLGCCWSWGFSEGVHYQGRV